MDFSCVSVLSPGGVERILEITQKFGKVRAHSEMEATIYGLLVHALLLLFVHRSHEWLQRSSPLSGLKDAAMLRTVLACGATHCGTTMPAALAFQLDDAGFVKPLEGLPLVKQF